MKIKEAVRRWPETAVNEWRKLANGAIAHRDASISDAVEISGPAVFRGGEFFDGMFRGGEFFDGMFRSGWFRGGVFHGGEFQGGVFQGGVFHGGMFRSGWFRGGVFHDTPLLVCGCVPWAVTVGRPAEVSIGCECHTIAEWRANLDAIANKHGVDQATSATIRSVLLPMFERWFSENPNVVTAAQAAGGDDG